MSNDVNLTASIRNNLLSLQSTTKLLAQTQDRLSSGKKVNSAIDDPSAFFAARSLNNRASDLSARKDGIGLGISALKSADKSLAAMTTLVEQAKSLATQAQEASGQISTISTKTAAVFTASTNVVQSTITGVATSDAFTVQVTGGTAATVTIGATTTAAQLAALIDAVDSSITAVYNASTNKIDISAPAGKDVTFTDTTNTPAATLFQGVTSGTAVTFGSTGSGTNITTLETNYKKIMDQIDTLKTDALYKGINLLNGNTLTVKFNEDATSTLDVVGVTYNHTGLGFTAKASVDFSVAANIDTALTETDAALSSIRSQQSTFGTNLSIVQAREDFTTDMINALQEGAGKLVNADLNEEGANMLALQTRQALGTQALVFANQAQQSVLSLFR